MSTMKKDYKKLGEYAKATTDWVLAYRDSMNDSQILNKESQE